MRPSHWIPSTAVWSGWHCDGTPRADSRTAQGVPVHQGEAAVVVRGGSLDPVSRRMERRGDAGYRVQTSQDSPMDRAWGWVGGGMLADGPVSFWNHVLGWEPLKQGAQDYWGRKDTKLHTAVPSPR